MSTKPIFISYSRADKEIVWQFGDMLADKLHTCCWIDKEDIEVGQDFVDSIYKGIDECKAVLFMLSDNSIGSEWTRREIAYAKKQNKRIIPVVIDGRDLRGWALKEFERIDFVDINQRESVNKLIKNLKTWYPNISNEHYLHLAKDYLANHPKELSYAVRFELDLFDFYVDMKIVSLNMDEVSRIRQCIAMEDMVADLDGRIAKHCPDVYHKLKDRLINKMFKVVKIEDIDKEMVFLTCNVAVFKDGMEGKPVIVKVPVSMTCADYEDLLAWKLESRPRDVFSLQLDMPLLCDRIVSQIKNCSYLYRDAIKHPFAFEIMELEQDANVILGEREIESLIFDLFEEEPFIPDGEHFQTILQIYERHLYFALSSSSWGNYTIELSDVRDFQQTIGATCYKDIQEWIMKEFYGEQGCTRFRKWLEEQNLPYQFHDNETLELGYWGPV